MEFKDSENFLFNGEPASISLGNGINGDEGATFFSNKDKKHGDYIDMNKSDGDGDGYIGMHMINMKKAFENMKKNRMDSDKYGNGNAKDDYIVKYGNGNDNDKYGNIVKYGGYIGMNNDKYGNGNGNKDKKHGDIDMNKSKQYVTEENKSMGIQQYDGTMMDIDYPYQSTHYETTPQIYDNNNNNNNNIKSTQYQPPPPIFDNNNNSNINSTHYEPPPPIYNESPHYNTSPPPIYSPPLSPFELSDEETEEEDIEKSPSPSVCLCRQLMLNGGVPKHKVKILSTQFTQWNNSREVCVYFIYII